MASNLNNPIYQAGMASAGKKKMEMAIAIVVAIVLILVIGWWMKNSKEAGPDAKVNPEMKQAEQTVDPLSPEVLKEEVDSVDLGNDLDLEFNEIDQELNSL